MKVFRFLLLLIIGLSAFSAQAQWTGAVNSDWHNPGNWVGGNIPTSIDFVFIDPATRDPVISTSVTLYGMQVNPGAGLTINSNGKLNLRNFDYRLAILDNLGTVTNNGEINIISFASENYAILNEGTFTNNGTVEVERTTNFGFLNATDGILDNKSGSSLLIGTVEAVEYDALRNFGQVINRGSMSLEKANVDGLGNNGTDATFSNLAGGTVNIGTQNGSIGRLGIRNNGTITNNASTINIGNTGILQPTIGWGCINQFSSTFSNINGAVLAIGQNGQPVQGHGLINTSSSTFLNSASTIKIDNVAQNSSIDGDALVVQTGAFDNTSAGLIEIGQGDGNIGRHGIYASHFPIFKNNGSTINIDHTAGHGISTIGTTDFMNSNNGQINIGQNGGTGNIGDVGISINNNTSLKNNGSTINIDNTTTHGINSLFNAEFLNSNNGQVNIGQNGGTDNIGDAGISMNNNTSFKNNGSTINIDHTTTYGINSLGNADFLNSNNGQINIGQNAGIDNTGLVGIHCEEESIFKNDWSVINIDNAVQHGIYLLSNNPFENNNNGQINIGQNGGTGNIGSNGIVLHWSAIFKNNESTINIDNVMAHGIYQLAFGPSNTFENNEGDILIGQNGGAGNIEGSGISCDGDFINNSGTVYIDNVNDNGIWIWLSKGNLQNSTNAKIHIGTNGVINDKGIDISSGSINNDGTLNAFGPVKIWKNGTVSGDGVYNVYGDWEHSGGTFTAGSSTVNIVGGIDTEIRGGGETAFNLLNINKDDNSVQVTAENGFSTAQDLNVEEGYLITEAGTIITTNRFYTRSDAKLTHNGRINAADRIELQGIIDGDGTYDTDNIFLTGNFVDFDEGANSTVILSGSGNGAFGSFNNSAKLNNFIIDKSVPNASVDIETTFRCRNFTLTSGTLIHDEALVADSITIEMDGKWEANGSLISVTEKLENNGQINGGSATILNFNSDTNTEVTGNAFMIGQLWVTKDAIDAEVAIDADIDVQGKIDFRTGQGIIDIASGSVLTLAPGAFIEDESEVAYIYGQGTLQTTVTLNLPNSVNPGNLGVAISSNTNLGSTTVKRYHQPQTINGQESILRYYDISPENNSGLDATVDFHYHDHELNGWSESDLAPCRFNGSNWELYTATENNTSQNYVVTEGIDAFSIWTLAPSSLLPVELIGFTVTKNDGHALLKWQTASETNNEGFEVEHSTDGWDWHHLSFVEGQGNSIERFDYSFVHQNPSSGRNYYRLRQIDFDGKFAYSTIQTVIFDHPNNQMVVFPNPASSFINIQLPGTFEQASMKVFATDGRMLFEQKQVIGESIVPVDVQGWEAGFYLIHLTANGQEHTHPFIVTKD
ncbi:MAG: T9SS type A sorting domain-containing protein [Bacteroidota bacterium]